MVNKLYDRALLFFTLVLVSPLVILAIISIGVGYPVHMIKNSILRKNNKKGG